MVGHTHYWQNTLPSAPNAGVFPSSISYTPQGKACWQPQLSLFVCMRACACACVCMSFATTAPIYNAYVCIRVYSTQTIYTNICKHLYTWPIHTHASTRVCVCISGFMCLFTYAEAVLPTQ